MRVRETNLLERAGELRALAEHLDSVMASARGHVTFIAGEAGGGKTELVRRFASGLPSSSTVIWGACDALATPRPLGPFVDVASVIGGELERLARTEARPHEFAAELLHELRERVPVVIVLEDLQWADAATLDVLRIVARRIESVGALVLATYRDDELDRMHPLRRTMGELATSAAVSRLRVPRLSPDAVTQLAQPHGVDAIELYRQTGGNPFFVAEVLAGGTQAVPANVQDAVLARVARLSAEGRDLVEAASVVPSPAELWLLERMSRDARGSIDECVSSGVMTSDGERLGFHHELARLAVESSLPQHRKTGLHAAALAALADSAEADRDPARLAHHAESAGDTASVTRYAPKAAARASALGAHREAAAHYARAIRAAGEGSPDVLASIFQRRAHACYLSGQFPEALDAQQRALDCFRALQESLRVGDALWHLSRLLRYVGRIKESIETAQDAIATLEQLPPGPELAMAYCNLSHLYVNSEDAEEARLWGRRALDLAEKLDHVEARVYAQTNLQVVDYLATASEDLVEGFQRILRVAQDAGLDEHSGRALLALTWWSPRFKSYELADRYYDLGLDYSLERGLDIWRHYFLPGFAKGFGLAFVIVSTGVLTLWATAGDGTKRLASPRWSYATRSRRSHGSWRWRSSGWCALAAVTRRAGRLSTRRRSSRPRPSSCSGASRWRSRGPKPSGLRDANRKSPAPRLAPWRSRRGGMHSRSSARWPAGGAARASGRRRPSTCRNATRSSCRADSWRRRRRGWRSDAGTRPR